jgi:ribosomal protein S18 acetylase RimI-like enzyme
MMGAVQVQVRRLERSDCTVAAGLHADQLPHGFFASLGPRWLRSYYTTFVASPHAVALVARSGGKTVGVLVGTTRNAAHYRWVLRHRGVALAGRGLAAMVLRPRVGAHFARTRVRRYARGLLRLTLQRMPWQRTGQASGPAPDDPAVLTHLAVHDGARGQGAGTALVEAFMAETERAGATRALLVTLAGDAGAGPFYKRLGWEHVEDRRGHDGQELSVFARPL